jgi:hypothetical protein
VGLIDNPHSAATQFLDDFVVPDFFADHNGIGRRGGVWFFCAFIWF